MPILQLPGDRGRPRWSANVVVIASLLLFAGCDRLPQKLGTIASPMLRFSAVGLESGISFVHVTGSAGSLLPYERLGAGCAVFDFNNDGWLDLYFPQSAPTAGTGGADRDWTNRLYQGGPGIHYVDVTRTAGVGGETPQGKLHSIGCAVGDWNNDGFDDLFVTGKDGWLLYQNGKDGTFTDVSRQWGLDPVAGVWTSATFIDYDRDGWLDLYVCRLGDADSGNQNDAPLTAVTKANLKQGSRLYRNEAGRQFRDVTTEVGVLEPRARSLGVIATDFNDDGWPDLCVTNDGVRNYLFQNDRGSFVERGRDAGIAVDESGVARPGRGIAGGSLVGDSPPDLLLTYGSGYPAVIYRSTRRELFALAGEPDQLPSPTKSGPGWGCAVGDFNLDGRADSIVVSGSELSESTKTSTGTGGFRSQVILSERGGWKDATGEMGRWFQEPHDARGVVPADLDNDGDLDLVITQLNQPPVLLRNEQRLGHHWYQLILVGETSNLGGLGARVTALLRSESLVSEVRSSSGFATSGDRRICFGLGAQRSLDGLEIRWPSGAVDVLPPITADMAVTLKEGGEVVSHRGKP